METVTISPKYQVILPKEICDLLSLFPGQRLYVIHRGNRIELIPVRSGQQMRGFLKGIDTKVERKGDRV